MSLTSIKDVFNFENKRLRVSGTVDDPWFCGKDVAFILGYKIPKDAIKDRVKDKHKTSLNQLRHRVGGNHPPIGYHEATSIYVNEAGLYELIFSCKLPVAEKFKDYVFEEVLPSIRKNGYYVSATITNDKIKELESKLREKEDCLHEKDLCLHEKDLCLKAKDDQLNRLHDIQKELLSYKKRISKDETVYIVSTSTYARQGIFKIGRTRTSMKFRSASHNTSHVAGDKIKVISEFRVHDALLVERNIHTKLKGLLVEGEQEFFMCPYKSLVNIVEMIIRNDEQENEIVNVMIDMVYSMKQQAYSSTFWTDGIPDDVFEDDTTIRLMQGKDQLAEFDVSSWTTEMKQQFIIDCLNEYVRIGNNVVDMVGENSTVIRWKSFQTFLVHRLRVKRNKFKVNDWKPIVKGEAEKARLLIKWKGVVA